MLPRDKITLWTLTDVSKGAGDREKVSTLYDTVWAEIRELSMREKLDAKINTEQTYEIKIRHNSSKPLFKPMLIKTSDGITLNITSIDIQTHQRQRWDYVIAEVTDDFNTTTTSSTTSTTTPVASTTTTTTGIPG